MANWVSGGVKHRSTAGEGVTHNQELACGEDIESSQPGCYTAGGIDGVSSSICDKMCRVVEIHG